MMPETPEQRRRRLHVWKHNSFFGHVRMMRSNLHSIIDSRSTAYESKIHASEALVIVDLLYKSLRHRIDPDNL